MMTPTRRCAGALALLAATLCSSGCGYRDMSQAQADMASTWHDAARVYTNRTQHATAAIAAAARQPGFDPQIVEDARSALARASALPAHAKLIDEPEAMDAFKRTQAELTGALFRLVGTAQSYAALRDDPAMQATRLDLTQAEAQLAAARERYSRSVSRYKALTQAFPGKVTSTLLGYGEAPANL